MRYRQTFEQSAKALQQTCTEDYENKIEAAVGMLTEAFKQGNKLLAFGNGGSSADAQHICGELVGRFLLNRPGLPAIALTSNQTLMTAWGNDHSFDSIFERQIQSFGKPGDVAWGISTSGNSENVVRAMRAAKSAGLKTIALTGQGGGRVAEHCDVLLAAASTETPRIQEVHLVTYHAICAAVEEKLFGAPKESTVASVPPASAAR